MADNTQLSTNVGTGDKLVTKDVTHGGDAGVKLQSVSLMGVSGTEGSYTIADINGDATNGLDVDVTRVPAPLSTTGGGTEDTALRVTVATDSTGVLSVDDNGSTLSIDDGAGSITVDGTVTANAGTGTFTVSGTVTANLSAGTNTNEVVGDAAHDATAAGNPVLTGAQMETMADSAPGTRASTDGDANKLATTDGALYVIPTGPQTWSYHVDGSSALTDATVHAAPGAGLSLYVTDIVFSSGAATAINAFFEEGTTKVLGPYYLEAVAGRGANIRFGSPKKITANTALTITTSAAIAHTVDVTGFIAPG